MNKYISKNLIVTSLLHLFVDFLCAGGLVLTLRLPYSDTSFAYVFLVYNLLAFLLQPLFGIIVDHLKDENKRKKHIALLLLSSGLVMIGWCLTIFQMLGSVKLLPLVFISSIFFGIGNALFHVVGGKEALTMSSKATPGGIFVSFGALGIGFATIINSSPFMELIYLIFAPAMLIALSYMHLGTARNNPELAYEERKNKSMGIFSLIVILLLLAVSIRSFLGFYTKMSDGISTWQAILLLSVAAFFGKAIGGIILDLVGPYVLIGISGVISIVCSIFLNIPFVDYIFVLSFNMLMPLTLDALRKVFPNKEGFSFGLCAAFLIPGYLIGGALKQYGNQQIVIPVICLLTGLMLVGVYILEDKVINVKRDK